MRNDAKIFVTDTAISKAKVANNASAQARVHAVLKSNVVKKTAKGSSLAVSTLLLAACGEDDDESAQSGGASLIISRADGVYSATSVDGFVLPSAAVATLSVADAANNAYSILLDADGAGILEFKFTDANDVVTLQAGSTIDDFGTLKVTSGTLDATLASITGVTRVEVASGVKLTLVQVREIPVLVSNDVTGRIEIVVNSIAEATELATLVQNQTIQFFGAAGNITVTAAEGASVTPDQITAQMSIVTSNVRPASETDTGAGVAAGARPATDTGDAGSGAASGGGTGVTDGGGTADPGFRLIAQSSQVFKLAEGYGDVAVTMQDGVLRFTTAASNSVTAVNTDVSGIQVDGLTLTASADVLSSMAVTGAGHLIMTGLAEDTVVTGLGVTGVTTLAGVACADQISQIAAGNANGTIVGTGLTAINGTAAIWEI